MSWLALQGIALFGFIPLVLFLYLSLPLGPGRSLGLGLALMLGHRFVASPWMARHAAQRCLWCGRSAGAGAVPIPVRAGGRDWILVACVTRHRDLTAQFLGFVFRFRLLIGLGIFVPLLILLGGTLGLALGHPVIAHETNRFQFRIVVACTVILTSLGYLAMRTNPDEPLRCPFPLHNLFLLGIRNTLWVFRVVGLFWLTVSLPPLHVAEAASSSGNSGLETRQDLATTPLPGPGQPLAATATRWATQALAATSAPAPAQLQATGSAPAPAPAHLQATGLAQATTRAVVQEPAGAQSSPASLQALLDETNQARRAHGLGSVSLSEDLTVAAQAHADDMLVRSYFSHISPEGRGPGDRLRRLSPRAIVLGLRENITKTEGDGGEGVRARAHMVVDGWFRSKGHRDNLLSAESLHVGFGAASGESADRRVELTVQLLGRVVGRWDQPPDERIGTPARWGAVLDPGVEFFLKDLSRPGRQYPTAGGSSIIWTGGVPLAVTRDGSRSLVEFPRLDPGRYELTARRPPESGYQLLRELTVVR